MKIKTIKVRKDGITKEVDANQEKNYASNGWTIVKGVIPNTQVYAQYRK